MEKILFCLATFLRQRFNSQRFTGWPLTILIVIFVCLLALFFGLAENILKQGVITIIDANLAGQIYVFRDASLVWFFLAVTLLGSKIFVLAAYVFLSFLFCRFRQNMYLLPFWLSAGGTVFFVWLTKTIMHRPRPIGVIPVHLENSYSFPSGHAALAVALYGFLVYLAWRLLKKWQYKINALLAGLIVILAIGFSRLYLGVHFLSDVVGGYALGFLWLIVAIAIGEFLLERRL